MHNGHVNTLLQRSGEFQAALAASFRSGLLLVDESPRLRTCAGACQLSLEHAAMVRVAFEAHAANSATALVRLQYEALLRAAWLLHAASDVEVDRLTADLDEESAQRAKNVAGPGDMLESLAAKAPAGLIGPLQQFDDLSRRGLNSYVHAGLHPLQRVAQGFPPLLAEQLVRNSNGLMHMAYRLLATLSGNQALVDSTTRAHLGFTDCLPFD